MQTQQGMVVKGIGIGTVIHESGMGTVFTPAMFSSNTYQFTENLACFAVGICITGNTESYQNGKSALVIRLRKNIEYSGCSHLAEDF